ncbi:MAG TPA: SDR family NAD(P)-dependent oxidoreductase [Actinomycetota bacterium]|nr:SDR family NAD(P)-dependent oxidoreductase [Actinomycetota bacterium]
MRPERVIDAALEATVVGGFSSIGYAVRSRLNDWDHDLDLTGQRILLTGGTSGIGLAAAREMTAAGAKVVITGRDESRLRSAATKIAAAGPRPITLAADSADLEAVAGMFQRATDSLGGLDVLVNNAGALTHTYTRTPQGFEQTYAVHVLAPFLLTRLSIPVVGTSGKVITVSSGGMYTQKLDPAAVEMNAADYDGVNSYAKAKRAQVVLNEAWARHYPRGPMFAAMHPGWADTPGVQDSLPGFRRLTAPILRTAEQGADTMVWLAASQVDSGRFWLDRRARSTVRLPWTRYSDAAVEDLFEQVQAQTDPYVP